MIVFKIIYYLLGFGLAFFELLKLTKMESYVKKMIDIAKYNKHKELDKKEGIERKMPDDLATYSIILLIWVILYLFWMGIGLFTYNWEFIISYLTISMISGKLFRGNKYKFNTWKVIYSSIWSVLMVIFYIFLALNSFHLHIQLNLMEFIKGLF